MGDNMYLWEQVKETDPRHTTEVNMRGGFTSIGAQYQLRQATKIWGTYGDRWGVEDVKYEYMESDGTVVEVIITAQFFYPNTDDQKVSFYISSDMAYSIDNDTRKKLMTDITTKALSKLGFGADVFMGLFDDNKYVSELKEKIAAEDGTKAQLLADILQTVDMKEGIDVNSFNRWWKALYAGKGEARLNDLYVTKLEDIKRLIEFPKTIKEITTFNKEAIGVDTGDK